MPINGNEEESFLGVKKRMMKKVKDEENSKKVSAADNND